MRAAAVAPRAVGGLGRGRGKGFLAITHGRERVQDVELAANADGRAVALRVRATANPLIAKGQVHDPAGQPRTGPLADNALGPLGVTDLDIPLTPDAVRRATRTARGSVTG